VRASELQWRDVAWHWQTALLCSQTFPSGLRVFGGWYGWSCSGCLREVAKRLHVQVGSSRRPRSPQAIKTKQFGRSHQRDKLSGRGLASPNGSSGPTYQKAAEILGTMLVHLPMAEGPRVCASGLGCSTLVETHGRKASPITPPPTTYPLHRAPLAKSGPARPHCDTTAASLACVLPCSPSRINR
jgi:hypothetical protein